MTGSIYKFFLYGSLKLLFTLSERRHSSSSKPPLTPPSSSVFSLISSFPSKNKGSSGSGSNRSSSGGTSASSSNSKLLKSPKDKLQISGNNRLMHSVQHSKVPHDKIMTPSVKVEKIHPKIDGAQLKAAVGPTCSTTKPEENTNNRKFLHKRLS
ncbi:ataxin-7-like, partial [Cyanistes caeruleus]|uniref:ataxin-7-like n=1 Tax=Cyanistes caeruleus TaxID=156563 RepID=UPI000CDB509F